MKNPCLIITSIASSDHAILSQYALEAAANSISFILIGDIKSPKDFNLQGCDYYSIERQYSLGWALSKELPLNHYARKNLGYLEAMSRGADIIIETDDDNIPLNNFWEMPARKVAANVLTDNGWVNVYKYFTEFQVWPRGFALEHIHDLIPKTKGKKNVLCPIQQGLADENPDVDAVYRLVLPLPITFNKSENIALGRNTICPFNSQNTTWFKEAFLLLYLPSYCSFRMTDIWRSFIAQRIAWTCDWNILFHQSTVLQKRNVHNLIDDLRDELPGYLNNKKIFSELQQLDLKNGIQCIPDNLIKCYQMFVDSNLIDRAEMILLRLWIADVNKIFNN